MVKKPTYEELEQRVKELEESLAQCTEEKEELRASQEYSKLMFEYAPDGFYLNDLKGTFIDGNKAAEKLCGYERDELIGKSFLKLNLLSPKQIAKAASHLMKSARGLPTGPDEFALNRKDGSQVELEISTYPIKVEGKTLVLGIARDITERRQIEEELKKHRDHLEELVKERTKRIAQTNEMLEQEIAERKRTEKELQESEKRYRDLADLLPQIVYESDEKGNFTFANRVAFEFSGYTTQDFDKGVNIFQALVPEDRKRAKENIQKVLKGERVRGNEYTALRKDGSTFPIVSYASPIICENKPIGTRGIIIDLTELKGAEEALRESEEKYRILVEHANEGIIVAQDGMLRFANSKIEEVTGYSQEELTSKPFVNFVHPEDQEKVTKRHWQRLNGKQVPEIYDFRIITKNGETKWTENKGVLINWEGAPATLNFLSEITDRKQAEETLRESEDRFRNLFENSRDALFIVTKDGNHLDVNQAALDLFGYTREEMLALNARDRYVNLEDRERNRNQVEEQGFFKDLEVPYRKKDGTEMECLATATIRRDKDGNILEYQNMIRDITEQKRLHAQLQQAHKMESIATLAGGIAHQFNNALSPITTNLDFLTMDYPNDENINSIVRGMRDSTRRMTHLTRQLLAYARGGKYQVKKVGLSDFVRDTLPLVEHTLKPSVYVETDLPHDISSIEADLTQMQMVLSAILSNASEAIEDKGRIRISCRNEMITEEMVKECPGLGSGPCVTLKIEDEGRGMDEKTRSRVFEPFFTTKFQGRGLGMAAAYGIVRNHGGWISVDSELGKGTTVSIYLPATEAKVQKEEEVESKPLKGSGTILLIEDEKAVMDVNRALLERIGCRVLEARTGKEAIDIVKTFDGDIDLALLDIVLPDMGGKEIYPLIKEARPDLKVLVCSGYSIDGPAQELLDLGAQGFIQKPFTLADLLHKLKKVLEGK